MDIGAFEVQKPIVSPTTLSNGTYGTAYSQTITATATGGAGAPYTFVITAGALPAGLSLATGGVLSGAPTVIGTFSFTVTGTDSGGFTGSQAYTIMVAPAPLTITPTTGQSKVYGAGVPALTYTASGFVNGDPPSLLTGALGTTATTGSPVGTYACTLGTLSAGSDYTLAMAANPPTLAVTPAPLTVSSITASNKVYDATTTAALVGLGTAKLNGVIGVDSVSLVTNGAIGTFASKDVGTNITVQVSGLSLSGAQASDYSVTQPSTTANITSARLTVSGITAANKVYNANTVATLSTTGAAPVGVFSGDTVTIDTGGATGTFASKGVGTGITVTVAGLTIGGAQSGDYTLTQPTTTADITPARVTVSGITAANKVYNANTAATLSTTGAAPVGVFSGDTVNLDAGGATGAFVSKDVGTGITVMVAGLTISGAQAGDYTLTQPSTTANITSARLTVSGITAANKVYNANTVATLSTTGAAPVGVFSGDTVTIDTGGATGTFASKDVGTGITVTVAGLTIGGAQSGDYTLTQPTTEASITPAMLSVAGVTATAKLYNASTTAALNALAAMLVGVFSGDAVTLSTGGATGTFASKDVGTGITVTVAGLTIGGAQSGDYTLTQPTTTADITPARVTVSGITAANKVYDANVTAALSTAGATLVGVFSGDVVTLGTGGATGTFASQGVGTGITVTVAGLTTSGAQAFDYSLTQPTTTANVATATLIASLTGAVDKTYDGTSIATLLPGNFILSGVLPGDNVALNDPTSGTYDSKAAGAGKAVSVSGLTLSGLAAADYQLGSTSITGAVGEIDKAALTITASDASKVYRAALPAFTAAYMGFVNGDTAASLTTAPSFSTTATAASPVSAGGYPITASGTVDGNYNITYEPGTLTVTPARLTITADDASKVYDAPLPGFTVTYTGFVKGDSPASLTTAPALSTSATATSPVVAAGYPITATGAVDPNYTITYAPGTLTVTPETPTISVFAPEAHSTPAPSPPPSHCRVTPARPVPSWKTSVPN